MENSLQQERDNSLQVRILNNSSFKITSSVSIGNFYTGSPEHTTFSLNTQVFEKEHTKVNFWGNTLLGGCIFLFKIQRL